MKGSLKSTLAALLICAFATVAAVAASKDKIKKETVTFTEDTMVSGSLLKAGEYEVRFNETTGELAFVKDGKVKAKTTARLQARGDKARSTAIRTMSKGNVVELIGFTFGGATQDVVVGTTGGTVTGN